MQDRNDGRQKSITYRANTRHARVGSLDWDSYDRCLCSTSIQKSGSDPTAALEDLFCSFLGIQSHEVEF